MNTFIGKQFTLVYADRLYDYLVVSLIGSGGYGSVWLGKRLGADRDETKTTIDEWISIKIIHDFSEYQDEVSNSKRIIESFNPFLGHVRCEDYGVLFMRLLDMNMYEVGRAGGLTNQSMRLIEKKIAEILNVIHQKYRMIYADMKPENVMIRLPTPRPSI